RRWRIQETLPAPTEKVAEPVAGGCGPGVPEAPVGCTMIHAVRYTVHACPVTLVSLRLPATAARGFSRSQIFVEMLRASHADECGADDRQRPHKGDGALRIASPIPACRTPSARTPSGDSGP